jgi:hypothetical protein
MGNKITYDNPNVNKRKAVMEYEDTGPITIEFFNDTGVLAERMSIYSRDFTIAAKQCRDWFEVVEDTSVTSTEY